MKYPGTLPAYVFLGEKIFSTICKNTCNFLVVRYNEHIETKCRRKRNEQTDSGPDDLRRSALLRFFNVCSTGGEIIMQKKQESMQVLCLRVILQHIIAHGKAAKAVGMLLQDGHGKPVKYIKWEKQ